MDPYSVLGVSSTATDDEIKKAYREKCKKYHPDLNQGNPAAEEMFKKVQAAYSDIQYRRSHGGHSEAENANPYRNAYNPYAGFGGYGRTSNPFGQNGNPHSQSNPYGQNGSNPYGNPFGQNSRGGFYGWPFGGFYYTTGGQNEPNMQNEQESEPQAPYRRSASYRSPLFGLMKFFAAIWLVRLALNLLFSLFGGARIGM